MRRLFRYLAYLFKSAWLGLWRHWALTLSALAAISVTLFLTAACLVTVVHVDRFSHSLEDSLRIHVVLNTDVSEEQTKAIGEQLKSLPQVTKVDFSDKDRELQLMIEEKGEAFSIYTEDNPLSDAYFVYLESGQQLAETAREIMKIEGVASAVYGGQSASNLADVLVKVRWIGYGAGGFLLLLSLYLIYNTIRSAIQSRQEEIQIMRQVGASNAYIKGPFELEGILLGAAGAAIPYFVFAWLYPNLYGMVGGKLGANTLSLVPADEMLATLALVLFGAGILMGWGASLLAAGKYLRAKR
jgi:cell division transport system permease protein